MVAEMATISFRQPGIRPIFGTPRAVAPAPAVASSASVSAALPPSRPAPMRSSAAHEGGIRRVAGASALVLAGLVAETRLLRRRAAALHLRRKRGFASVVQCAAAKSVSKPSKEEKEKKWAERVDQMIPTLMEELNTVLVSLVPRNLTGDDTASFLTKNGENWKATLEFRVASDLQEQLPGVTEKDLRFEGEMRTTEAAAQLNVMAKALEFLEKKCPEKITLSKRKRKQIKSLDIVSAIRASLGEAESKDKSEKVDKAEPEAKAETQSKDNAEAKAAAEPKAKAETPPKATSESKAADEPEAKTEAKSKDTSEAKTTAEPEAKAETKSKDTSKAKNAADPEAKAETKSKDKSEAKASTEPEAKADTKSKDKSEAKDAAEPEAKAETQSKDKSEANAVAGTDATAKTPPKATSEAKAAAEKEPNADAKSKDEPEAKTTAEPEAKAETQSKDKSEAEATTEPEAKAETKSKDTSEAKAAAEPKDEEEKTAKIDNNAKKNIQKITDPAEYLNQMIFEAVTQLLPRAIKQDDVRSLVQKVTDNGTQAFFDLKIADEVDKTLPGVTAKDLKFESDIMDGEEGAKVDVMVKVLDFLAEKNPQLTGDWPKARKRCVKNLRTAKEAALALEMEIVETAQRELRTKVSILCARLEIKHARPSIERNKTDSGEEALLLCGSFEGLGLPERYVCPVSENNFKSAKLEVCKQAIAALDKLMKDEDRKKFEEHEAELKTGQVPKTKLTNLLQRINGKNPTKEDLKVTTEKKDNGNFQVTFEVPNNLPQDAVTKLVSAESDDEQECEADVYRQAIDLILKTWGDKVDEVKKRLASKIKERLNVEIKEDEWTVKIDKQGKNSSKITLDTPDLRKSGGPESKRFQSKGETLWATLQVFEKAESEFVQWAQKQKSAKTQDTKEKEKSPREMSADEFIEKFELDEKAAKIMRALENPKAVLDAPRDWDKVRDPNAYVFATVKRLEPEAFKVLEEKPTEKKPATSAVQTVTPVTVSEKTPSTPSSPSQQSPPSTSQRSVPTQTPQQQVLWGSQWYPVGFPKFMDKRRPHSFQVLGAPLVVWWDKSRQAWTAAVDRNPHRWAKLSEGTINEDGLLECALTGWTFEGNGQFAGSKSMKSSTMVDSRRGCLTPIPLHERQGLLWVWGARLLGSSATPDILKLEEILSGAVDSPSVASVDYCRDLPVDHSLLCEVLLDPVKESLTRYLPVLGEFSSPTRDVHITLSKRTGFTANYGSETEPSTLDFRAPHVVLQQTQHQHVVKHIVAYAVPVGPGRSKLVLRVAVDTATLPFFQRIRLRSLLRMPHFVLANYVHKAVEEDMVLLHTLGMSMRDGPRVQPADWKKDLYYIQSEDALPTVYRTWLDQFVDGRGPPWSPMAAPGSLALRSGPRDSLVDRSAALDDNCSQALRRAKRGSRAAEIVAAAAIGAAALGAGTPALGVAGAAVAVAGASSAIADWISVPVPERRG